MAYGYQGITIKSRFSTVETDDEGTHVHMSGNGGPADITLGIEDGERYVEVEARNDAFDYDFHERIEGDIDTEDIPGGVIYRFKTVNRYMGTVVLYKDGLAQNLFSLEVF